MQVNKVSPVDAEKKPFLANWDAVARRNFAFFESMKVAAGRNLQNILGSPLTDWRTVSQCRDRYQAIDTITMRQQLGDISHNEIGELNRVLGGSMTHFTKGSQPAQVNAWDKPSNIMMLVGGFAFAVYGLAMLRSNYLWIGAAPLPFLINMQINKSRQDEDALQNAYRYLLTKRAATAEFEQNRSVVPKSEPLHQVLSQTHCTLYELEQTIVAKIADSQF